MTRGWSILVVYLTVTSISGFYLERKEAHEQRQDNVRKSRSTEDNSAAVHHEVEEEKNVEQEDPVKKDKNVLDIIITNNQGHDANLFEGDIDVAGSFQPGIDFSKNGDIDGKTIQEAIKKRNAIREREYLWSTRIIPYVITPELNEITDLIQSAFKVYEANTCLRFVPHSGEKNYLKFVKKNGCYSNVGRVYWETGPQDISLGEGCHFKGTVIHEVMHALGFWHEQSRPDRNNYVEIMWENIQKGAELNFNKYSHDKTDSMVGYDYGSIMHYGKYAFTSNGKQTIKTIDKDQEIGQRDTLSPKDIEEINLLYDCKNPKAHGWSSWTKWGKCDMACYRVRQRFCPDVNKANCPGVSDYNVGSEVKKCTDAECYAPVDGHWGRWGTWGACSKTCGTGKKTRTRKCDDPLAANGGKKCPGSGTQTADCRLKSCGGGPDDCEFEKDMCTWKNDQTDDVDWHRITGATITKATGPQGDHTTGTGYYVYFEASSPTANGNKARLVSRVMKGNAKRCLSFWYHMYGSRMGRFKVLRKDSRSSATKTLFEKSGDQGNKWILGEVTYDGGTPHQIVFEAQRTVSFRSDMGLDDISIKENACGATSGTSGTTESVSKGGKKTSQCSAALGMESRAITDDQISASSIYDMWHDAQYGRLNANTVWCVDPLLKDKKNQYIQVTFPKEMIITAVATQGQSDWENWVTAFEVTYSKDGMMYQRYHEKDQIIIFNANQDRNSIVKHTFGRQFTARMVRILPQSYSGNDSCMRIELYGCPAA